VEGWGKTSLAAYAPKPIFLQTKGETGIETLIEALRLPETPHFPESQDWNSLLSAVDVLRTQEHEFRTVVIDALNGAERMCYEHVCARDFSGDWGELGFLAYGKGPEIALADWRILLNKLDDLRSSRKMTVFILCHTKVKSFKNPTGADYDRYQPDMNEKTWGLTHKWADCVLFGNFDVTVQGKGGKEIVDTSKKGKGMGGKQRILYTERDAAYDAKNRLGLPAEIDMGGSAAEGWSNFMSAVKAAKETTQEVGS
jgi:hypothetical protein